MKNYLFVSMLCLSLVCFSGCGGKQKPTDLPPLFPVKITVIQDGKPLEKAVVSLSADGTKVRFTIGGITDQNGVATLKTDGEWPGAPAGKYKICINKTVVPEPDPGEDALSREEQNAKAAERNKLTKSVVNSKFSRPNSTTFSIEVTDSRVTETCDVGAAVDDFLNRISGGSSSSR